MASPRSNGTRRLLVRTLAGLAVLAAACALAVAAAFLPSVQRALLGRLLAANGATNIRLDSLRVTPWTLVAGRAAFDRGPLHADARGVRLELSPWSLRNRLLTVDRLSVDEIDLSWRVEEGPPPGRNPPPPSLRAPAGPSRAAGTPLRLPLAVSIGSLSVKGRVSVLRSTERILRADFSLNGSGTAPASALRAASGRIAFAADASGSLLGAAREIRASGLAVAAGGTGGAPPSLEVTAELRLPEAPRTAGRAEPGATVCLAYSNSGSPGPPDLDASIDAGRFPVGWLVPSLAPLGGELAATVRGTVRLGPSPSADVSGLEVALSAPAARAGVVARVRLLRPVAIDLRHPASALGRLPEGTLAGLSFHGLPIGWVSRWLPGRKLSGTLAEGESTIARTKDGGFSLASPVPWRFSDLSFAEGGRIYFDGKLTASPDGAYGPAARYVRLMALSAEDVRGYRITGRVGAGIREEDLRRGGGLALEVDLPRLRAFGLDLGPSHASLRALAHLYPDGGADLSKLSVDLRTSSGNALFSVGADQPVTLKRTPQFEWLASCPAPLRFTTGRLPLDRLNPLLAPRNLSIAGWLPPTTLELTLAPRRLKLETRRPLAISQFRLERGGRILINRALLRTGMELELAYESRTLPVFRFRYDGSFALRDGLVAAEDSSVAAFSGRIAFSGTRRSVRPTDAAGSLRLDLGSLGRLPFLAHAPLPATGLFTATVVKSTTQAHVLDLNARLDHLVGRDGASRPDLLITGKAGSDVNRRVGGFGLWATLLTPSRPSDLHFGIRVDYRRLEVLDLSSRLVGTYVDVDAVRQFLGAFAPAPGRALLSPADPLPANKEKRSSLVSRWLPSEGPPWGPIRGHFILAVKTVSLAPYTIDNLAGRLDATGDSLILSGLSGTVLGGRWTAGLTARVRKGDSAGAEAFDGRFRLQQFDAGRAMRLSFPHTPAGVDGLIDLDLSVSSRADSWAGLQSHLIGTFDLASHRGVVHLALPDQGEIAHLCFLGGALTFSSQLRALGRLVDRLGRIPIVRLQGEGNLGEDGDLRLARMLLEAPDLRIQATGSVAGARSREVMEQPLSAEATLAARGDYAVILGGMHLLGPAGADGYRPMTQPFAIAGRVGEPDLRPLYELLARAVQGSHGSWGLLMRQLQARVARGR